MVYLLAAQYLANKRYQRCLACQPTIEKKEQFLNATNDKQNNQYTQTTKQQHRHNKKRQGANEQIQANQMHVFVEKNGADAYLLVYNGYGNRGGSV